MLGYKHKVQKPPFWAHFENFFENLRKTSPNLAAHSPHNVILPMDLPPSTPPPRPRDGELPLGRRYAIAVEVALAIPPGNRRVPKGSLDPICKRYGVGPQVSWF